MRIGANTRSVDPGGGLLQDEIHTVIGTFIEKFKWKQNAKKTFLKSEKYQMFSMLKPRPVANFRKNIFYVLDNEIVISLFYWCSWSTATILP